MKGEYDLLDNLHKNTEYQTNSYRSIFLTIFEGGEIVHVQNSESFRIPVNNGESLK